MHYIYVFVNIDYLALLSHIIYIFYIYSPVDSPVVVETDVDVEAISLAILRSICEEDASSFTYFS